jgi:hypothetical protein
MSPIVSPRRPCERSRRPALRVLGAREQADAPAASTEATVLLAGADPGRRAALRGELGATLPARTGFSEAGEVAEVLERAPRSRMVVLTGDLDDADAGSLLRLLGQRHPQLPVVSVFDEPLPTGTAARG